MSNRTDFNDMHREKGANPVAETITSVINEQKKITNKKSISDEKSTNISSWDEPILFGQSKAKDINPMLLPGYIGLYASSLAETLQVPSALPTLYALSVLSTSLQKKFIVHAGGDYFEPVNIWVVMVMDSGERKSPIIQALTKPLHLWEKNRNDREKSSIFENETKRMVSQKRIDRLRNDAAKEDSPEARERILAEIQTISDENPDEIKPTRLFTGDVTPERLQQLLVEQHGRMAVLSDEGGIFNILSGIYSGGDIYTDVFLQAYSGSPVRVQRASREAVVDKPTLTLGVAIQPQIFGEMRPEVRRKLRSNGLFARCFFGKPDGRVGKRNMRLQGVVPNEIREGYKNHILHLLDINCAVDLDGESCEHVLTLDGDARVVWEDFAQRIEYAQADGGTLESIRDWCAKLPGGVLRIAGLLHVAEHSLRSSVISAETMSRAVEFADCLITHSQSVFDLVASDQASSDAQIAWQWIIKHAADIDGYLSFKRSDLHLHYRSRFPTLDRLVAALDILIGRNLISKPAKLRNGGRPSIVHRLNPSVVID